MPKILSYNSSSKEDKKAGSQNPLKSIFEWFNSQEKFTKFFLIFAVLLAIATPVIVSQYLDYRQYAEDAPVAPAPTILPSGNSDTDSDGFLDSIESYLGTDPSKNCMAVSASGAPNTAWPPDFTGDNKVNESDTSAFNPVFGKKTGDTGFNVRYDLNKNAVINGQDILMLNKYFGTTCQPSSSGTGTRQSFSEPVRAAFYYGWYPQQWKDAGRRYIANLGAYDSSSTAIIDKHIDWMKYANIDGGIYSWWGISHHTNPRFKSYLDRAQAKDFKWGIYYELDWKSQRTLEQVRTDMSYLRDNYFSHSGYLYVNNKPVVFVYMPNVPSEAEGCVQIAKWTTIRNEYNLYVNLMAVPQWWTCNTLDSWHTYRSDKYVDAVGIRDTVYSIAISAGFWPAWETAPKLARDFSIWQSAVATFPIKKPKWELVYFNEFGEGSNIEPSSARCTEADCLDYLKVLNQTP